MYVVVIDVFAFALFLAGALLLASSWKADRRAADRADAGSYGRRIGGTMLAAFGLALGLMVTLFHFASPA